MTEALDEIVRRRIVQTEPGRASSATLRIPSGVYYLESKVTIPAYVNVEGENSIIVLAGGITGFDMEQMTSVSKLIFVGGATQINLTTGNYNSAQVTLNDCQFINYTGTAITTVNSASTSFVINRPRVRGTIAGSTWIDANTDGTFINDAWIQGNTTASPLIINRDTMSIVGVTGGAETPLSAHPWIANYGWDLHVEKFRFGGEPDKLHIKIS
jgi:hypothetical protein